MSKIVSEKPRILYVDDEKANLTSFKYQFRDYYEIYLANSAEEADDVIRQNDIQVIIADQRMPGETGVEFLERILPEYPDMPRMILTGYSDIEAVIQAINKCKVYYYFKKPWNEDEVRMIIDNALEAIELQKQNQISEERLRSTFEQAAVGIAHVTPDGRILRINQRLCDILGYTEEEMLALTVPEFTHPGDVATDVTEIQELLAGKRQTYSIEKRYIRKDGSVVWGNVTVSMVREPAYELEYLIAIIEDISGRKRAEEALREAETKYRLLVEQIPAITYIAALDEVGGTLYVSPQIETMLGFSQAEWTADPQLWLKQLHPGDHERVRAELARFRASDEPFRSEYRLLTRDGRAVWFRDESAIVRDEAGQPLFVQGIKLDITARKRAEERIEHLNAVLRAIRNVNQLIVKERDRDRLLQGACDNLIETRGYYNAWVALLDEAGGFVTTVEAGVGEDFPLMVRQLKRGELPSCASKALAQSGVVVVKDPALTCADCPLSAKYSGRGGMSIRLEHGEKVYGLLVVSMSANFIADEEEQALFQELAGDIAFALRSMELEEERKRAEEALRASEAKHRTLLENLPQNIFFKDRNSVYLACNENYARDLGITREKIAGKTDYDFYPKDLAEKYKSDNERIVASGRTEDIEERYIVGGQESWVQTVKTPVKDKEENTIGVLGIFWDITERKRAEEKLKERLEELQRWHSVTLGREDRVQELKREVNELLVRLGESIRYPSQEARR